MARKERDPLIGDDHQYASRLYSYLTPPSTPRLESFVDGDESDYFVKESTFTDNFDLYSTTCFDDNEENDPFYDFAEDFRDLRLPMLKSDCMWGTAEQIRSSRASPDNSNISLTRCPSRNFAATPLQLSFRSTATTPIIFDDRSSMNLFVPITSTVSPREIENISKDAVTPLKPSSNFAATKNLPLLSPNETESEDEIDVVSVPERQKTPANDTTTISHDRNHQKAAEKLKKAVFTTTSSSPASVSASPNSSDTDESVSPSGRIRNGGPAHGRVSHNDLERKRRDELKRKFDCLRAAIPEIENNERAPKVVILKKAKAFVPRLQEEEKELRTEKENLKRVNSLLMRKLLLLTKRN